MSLRILFLTLLHSQRLLELLGTLPAAGVPQLTSPAQPRGSAQWTDTRNISVAHAHVPGPNHSTVHHRWVVLSSAPLTRTADPLKDPWAKPSM